MPIPVMTLISSGKHAAGKQNLIKEIMISPMPGVSIDKVKCRQKNKSFSYQKLITYSKGLTAVHFFGSMLQNIHLFR